MTSKWPTMKLSEICTLTMGRTPARSDKSLWDIEKNGQNVWVSIADLPLKPMTTIATSKEFISDEAASKFPAVPPGTLLMSFKLSIGRTAISGCSLRTNEAIMAFTHLNTEIVDVRFLGLYLSHFNWNRHTEGEDKLLGSTMNKAKLVEFQIPVPPLDEQKRIVEKLDEILDYIDKAVQIKQQVIETHADLLNKVHDKELHSTDVQEFVTLGSLAEVKTGPFGTVLHKSDYADEGVPIVNPINMVGGSIAVDKRVNVRVANKLTSYQLELGDVVIARRGELGRCAVIDENSEGFLCGTGSFFVRCKSDLSPDFLREWLSSRSTVANLVGISTGTTMSNLSNTQLANLKIPMLALAEQEEILRRIRDIRNFAQSQSNLARQTISSLRSLRAAILSAAYLGDF